MSSHSEYTMLEIERVLENTQGLGDADQVQETLKQIAALDYAFEKAGGSFFALDQDPFKSAEEFTRLHVEQYRQNARPSLPALAVHHARQLGVDPESALYKAMIMVAVRAEMKSTFSPDYHSKCHYMDVAAMTANFLNKNNQITGGTPLAVHEQALAFIAAIGHDLEHPGAMNPSDNPVLNEEKSFAVMLPLLHEAGLSAADIEKIHVILMTTSPNGPHSFLKAVMHAQREGQAVDLSQMDVQNKFPALKNLVADPHLAQMAAIVSDADLYASAGAGMKAHMVMSALLTAEMQKAGTCMDLISPKARQYFLDHIVGTEGFSSTAGRAVAHPPLEVLRSETEKQLKALPVVKPPKP